MKKLLSLLCLLGALFLLGTVSLIQTVWAGTATLSVDYDALALAAASGGDVIGCDAVASMYGISGGVAGRSTGAQPGLSSVLQGLSERNPCATTTPLRPSLLPSELLLLGQLAKASSSPVAIFPLPDGPFEIAYGPKSAYEAARFGSAHGRTRRANEFGPQLGLFPPSLHTPINQSGTLADYQVVYITEGKRTDNLVSGDQFGQAGHGLVSTSRASANNWRQQAAVRAESESDVPQTAMSLALREWVSVAKNTLTDPLTYAALFVLVGLWEGWKFVLRRHARH